MSSAVCQGLQSCLKEEISQNEEKSDNNRDNNNNNKNKINGDSGGWSFIQALTDPSQNYKPSSSTDHQNEKVYIHPLDKHSSSTLTSKGLEMCTESLGSETGSDIGESSDEFSSLNWEKNKIKQTKCQNPTKQFNRIRSFPPPLTSISGSEGVQVRPHREGGRLVIKAVTISSGKTYFQANRTLGRLRLSLPRDCSVISNNEEDGEVVEKGNADEVEADEEVYDDEGDWDKDIEGNCGNVGCEIGIGELPRPSRCKESRPGKSGPRPAGRPARL